jgi:hypothetical protein
MDGPGREHVIREIDRCLERTNRVGDDCGIEDDRALRTSRRNGCQAKAYALTAGESTANNVCFGRADNL